MKNYEKPELMVLSFTVNDALCTGCAQKTKSDGGLNAMLMTAFGDDGDDVFTLKDAAEYFGTEEACTNKATGFESYCKFTGTSNKLFTS